MTNIPLGWARAKLPELVCPDGIFIDGDWVESKDQAPTGDVRLVQLADIGDGCYTRKSNRFLTSATASRLNCTFLATGDVLIARMPDPLGRACIFPGDTKRAVTVVDVAILRSGSGGVDHQWLVYAINAKQIRAAVAALASGTTRNRISRGNLATIELLIPPITEQRRIVAKLDAIFEQTRAAKARLERLPVRLEKLKRSILAAAFRGDLTADWRAAHPDVEPARVLLDRIRTERRRRWEADLRAKGKDPAKAKYEEPTPVDAVVLPELPAGWAWTSVGAFSSLVTDGEHATPPRTSAGIPLLSARNVRDGHIDLSDHDWISAETHEQLSRRLSVRAGDILLSCSGSVGRSCVVPPGLGFSLVRSVAVIRPLFQDGNYLSLCLRSPFLQTQIDQSKTETAQANIFQGRIVRLVLPVAPLAERREIEVRVDRLFARLDEIVASVLRLAERTGALERAALAKAFRGELVSQDPNDEPAAVLLDRIRAARAEVPESRRSSRGPHPTNAPISSRKSNGHRTTASSEDSFDLVIAALQQGEPRCTAADIAEATNLDAPAVKQVLKTLVAAGQVRVHGKARGTAYEWIA